MSWLSLGLLLVVVFFVAACASTQSSSSNATILEDTTNQKTSVRTVTKDLLIQLKAQQDIKTFVKDFENYQLTIIKEVSPVMRAWLVSAVIPENELDTILDTLKKHDSIQSASFNKKTTYRER